MKSKKCLLLIIAICTCTSFIACTSSKPNEDKENSTEVTTETPDEEVNKDTAETPDEEVNKDTAETPNNENDSTSNKKPEIDTETSENINSNIKSTIIKESIKILSNSGMDVKDLKYLEETNVKEEWTQLDIFKNTTKLHTLTLTTGAEITYYYDFENKNLFEDTIDGLIHVNTNKNLTPPVESKDSIVKASIKILSESGMDVKDLNYIKETTVKDEWKNIDVFQNTTKLHELTLTNGSETTYYYDFENKNLFEHNTGVLFWINGSNHSFNLLK